MFFRNKLPKIYNFGYKGFFAFTYKENKRRTREWDQWVRESNPSMNTVWFRLYRLLPYRFYWLFAKSVLGRRL